MQAPRGPVFVSIPADDWEIRTEWVELRSVSQAIAPDPQALSRVASALNACRRPAFVVGAGVDRDGAVEKVVQLAERHQAAVYVAPMSARCGFPENHPQFAGFLPALRESIVARLQEHDLIVVLGAPAFIYHVEGHGPTVPNGAKLFQIVDDAQTAAWTPSGDSVVSSVGLAVDALLAQSEPVKRSVPNGRVLPPQAQASLPMSVGYVLQALNGLRGDNDVVVEEAPGSRSVMQAFLPMQGADSFYTMASGGLGHGMPAAVGVALGRQRLGLSGRVIALIGDGSSMYSIQALYTAAQLKLPITFVILNNRRYAALQDFAPVFGYAPGAKPAGTDLPDLDFVKLAEGQGMQAESIADPHALSSALERALNHAAPYLIDISVA